MLNLFISILLLLGQADGVQFSLINTGKDAVIIELPGFRSLTLEEDQSSELMFRPGQEVYAVRDLDGDQELDRVLLFVVAPSHSGQVIKVDRELKKATKVFLSQN